MHWDWRFVPFSTAAPTPSLVLWLVRSSRQRRGLRFCRIGYRDLVSVDWLVRGLNCTVTMQVPPLAVSVARPILPQVVPGATIKISVALVPERTACFTPVSETVPLLVNANTCAGSSGQASFRAAVVPGQFLVRVAVQVAGRKLTAVIPVSVRVTGEPEKVRLPVTVAVPVAVPGPAGVKTTLTVQLLLAAGKVTVQVPPLAPVSAENGAVTATP